MIDVDDIVSDPDFAEPIQVFRRQYTNGGAYDINAISPQPWAAVQSGVNKDLLRATDYAMTDKFITVYSQFNLYPEGATFNQDQSPEAMAETDAYGNQIFSSNPMKYKADIVFWHGDPYEVFSLQDWTDYGTGYVCAVCRKITMGEAGLP